MAQLKDTIVNGGLRATESVASPIGQFDTIYAKEEVSTGITENYTSGEDKKILQSGTFDSKKTTYWASLSPIIDLTQGTSENGPKIGATIAGVSTLPNDRTEINKATTNIYGVTKLTGSYNASTPNNNLAATGEAIKAAIGTLNSNIPDSSNPNLETAGANKTLTALSIQSGKIDAATFTEIAIDSSQITSGIGRNTILYGDSTGVIQSAAPAWGDWDNGTAAGPQAKIQIGAITYTSPAIPAASTDISGIVTTEAQSFIGNKSFYSVVDFRATSGEGGEIHLNASDENTSQAGIVLDVRESKFRIFGIASADGETINGVGTPLVIDPYNKTITGGYTLTGHASLDLPLTGGTMTGKITFNKVINAIAYTGTKATYDMIKFKDNTTTTDGNGIIIGGAGLTCIGGGESADTIAAQFSSGGSENLCLSNDGAIDFYTNCQNGFSSAVHTSISTTGTYTHEDSGVSYVAGSKGDHAALYAKKAYNQDHWYPAVALETKGGGAWQIGNYNDETLEFVYFPKDKRDNNTNSGQTEVYLTSAGEFVGRHNSLNLTNICFDWNGSYTTGSWMLIYNGETGNYGGAKFKAINQANTATWVDGAHKWTRIGGDTMTGDLFFADSGTTTRQIRGIVGTNDYWRIAGGATAANAGWMEIATADDGNEPIYVRQYTGAYATITRTLTLLDASGNTSLPGNLTISHATNATMTAASTNPQITFAENGGQPVHLIYTDYDSYRSPAGLKVIGGTDATPAWFEVEGQVYAARFNGPLTGNVTGNCSGSSGSCTGNAATATNADKVDNYHASDLWRKDGGTWNGNANIACTPTANNQEYSFDLGNAYTGTYWHVWSGKNSASILQCFNDDRRVVVPVKLETAWLHVVSDSSNNADDALVYIAKKTTNDWALKIQTNANRYGIFIDSLDQDDAIRTNGYIRARMIWANQGSNGERQVGVDSATSGNLYLYANTSGKGLYSNSGYRVGAVITINSTETVFNGRCTGTSANVTGTVAIAHGGTGGTLPAAARKNLHIRSGSTASGSVAAGATSSVTVSLDQTVGSTNYSVIHNIRSSSVNDLTKMLVYVSDRAGTSFHLNFRNTHTGALSCTVDWILIVHDN